jgi:hypothetical protein
MKFKLVGSVSLPSCGIIETAQVDSFVKITPTICKIEDSNDLKRQLYTIIQNMLTT